MSFDYEPPAVAWVPILASSGKPVGFRVDPPFGVNWEHLRTLRHFAALIEHRTGHKVRVRERPVTSNEVLSRGVDPEQYEVLTEHATTGEPAGFGVVYAWLSGFENGIHEVLWRASKRQASES